MKSIKGFSLIELLVVCGILGTLAAIGTIAYNGYIRASQERIVDYESAAMKSATEVGKVSPCSTDCITFENSSGN